MFEPTQFLLTLIILTIHKILSSFTCKSDTLVNYFGKARGLDLANNNKDLDVYCHFTQEVTLANL